MNDTLFGESNTEDELLSRILAAESAIAGAVVDLAMRHRDLRWEDQPLWQSRETMMWHDWRYKTSYGIWGWGE